MTNCRLIHPRKWGYTVIQNPILNDANISLKAKGLYCFMQSKPDTWEFSIKGLCAELSEGRAAIMAALKELRTAGYLAVDTVRDAHGRFAASIYTLYDTPQMDEEAESFDSENISPESDFPHSGFPHSENPHQVNKDLSNYLPKQIPPVAPRGGGAGFEQVWVAFPKKTNRHAAERAWRKLKPSPQLVERMLTAIREQSQSSQWQREDGRYIPALSRWLSGQRWEDEQPSRSPTQALPSDDLFLAFAEMRRWTND